MVHNSVQDGQVRKLTNQKKQLAITVLALVLVLGALLVYAFQLHQNFSVETAKNTSLATELEATKNKLAAETTENTRMASEMAATRGRLDAELSRKPLMPVRLSYQKSLMGEGLVAVFRNTSTQHLSVLATFTNSQLGTSSTFRLELPPDKDVNFGHLEGWRFNPGDEITLVNNTFESLKSAISAP